MTDHPEFNEPLDIDRLIEEGRTNPEVQKIRAEMQAEAARFRAQSLFRLFRDVTRAEGLPEAERAALLRDRALAIYEDAALSDELLDAAGDAIDEPDLAVEAALLQAADPFTGRVPAEYQLPAELQARYDANPELRAFRAELPEIIAGDAAEHIRSAAERLLAAYSQTHRVDPEAISIAVGEPQFADHGLGFRDAVTETEEEDGAPGETQPGDVIPRYFEDAQRHFRLEESRQLRDDGRFDLWLRLLEPGSDTLMVAKRAEWRLTATLGEAELALTADDLYPDAWRLADPLDDEQLKRIAYDVSLSP